MPLGAHLSSCRAQLSDTAELSIQHFSCVHAFQGVLQMGDVADHAHTMAFLSVMVVSLRWPHYNSMSQSGNPCHVAVTRHLNRHVPERYITPFSQGRSAKGFQ
jgi:hypothetical protein